MTCSGWLIDNNGPTWRGLLAIDLENGGLVNADEFLDFIADKFEAREFADLEIPLKIIATNYWDGEQHVFDQGDLFIALKASMAVPGIFKPVQLDGKLLIDGGTANPLPVEHAGDHDILVAIDVTGVRQPQGDETPGITDLLFKTFEIMQQSIIRGEIEKHPPDIYIKPELSGVRLLHFDRVDEVVEQAAEAAEELRERLNSVYGCSE